MKWLHKSAGSPMFSAGCLADILLRAHKLKVKNDDSRFEFKATDHDTGCNVCIYIKLPDLSPRCIYNTCYWYESRYTSNKTSFESGKWDTALEEDIDKLFGKVKLEEHKIELEKIEKEVASRNAARREKEKYEEHFN
jgi:hypothetical protein